MDYYYKNPDAERVGPLDESTFFEHAAVGMFSAETLVWRGGETEWARWSDVAEAWSAGCVPELPPPETSPVSADVGVDSLFGDSWTIFKAHWGKFLFAGIVCSAFSLLSGGAEALLRIAVAGSEESGALPPVGALALCSALMLVLWALGNVFYLGVVKIVSREAAGKPVRFGDVFPLGRALMKLPKFVGLSLVALLIVLPIYFLFVVFLAAMFDTDVIGLFSGALVVLLGAAAAWGVLGYLGLRFMFAWLFIFETDCGVFASLSASWSVTRGRFWRTLGYGVLTTLMLWFGILCTFGLGAVALLPLSMIWLTVYYLKLRRTCAVPVPAGTL